VPILYDPARKTFNSFTGFHAIAPERWERAMNLSIPSPDSTSYSVKVIDVKIVLSIPSPDSTFARLYFDKTGLGNVIDFQFLHRIPRTIASIISMYSGGKSFNSFTGFHAVLMI